MSDLSLLIAADVILTIAVVVLFVLVLYFRKTVVISPPPVPVTVSTDKQTYALGDVETISGTAGPNAAVSLSETDSLGAQTNLPDVTAGPDGNFSATAVIQNVAAGSVTLAATSLGVVGTTTFTRKSTLTQKIKQMRMLNQIGIHKN